MYQPISILSNDYYLSVYYNGPDRHQQGALPVDAFVVTDDSKHQALL